MRQITRRVTVAILVVLALLLALGALPSYLKSGDPYYLTATPADGNHSAVDLSNASERRYEYAIGAVRDAEAETGVNVTETNVTGRSDPYWKGPVGLKESFTNSPFDEMDALRIQNESAVEGETVYATYNGTLYRLAVAQDP
jgi:hypothetical protein